MKIKKLICLGIISMMIPYLTACGTSAAPDASVTPKEEDNIGDYEAEASPEERTLNTFEQIADGVYFMEYYADYKLEDYLAANINTVEGFDRWMTENLTQGVPTGEFPEIGCSSFVIKSPEGDHLFGRNYEMREADSMVIRTDPEDGYASIGIVDMMHMNYGQGGEYAIGDESAKTLLLAAPWCVCDGINEKGLGVSLLSLNDPHDIEDTEKDDLLIYAAIRILLDRCADVTEAEELLKSYDMYSPSQHSYHIFLTDRSGKSVIVEWAENETHIVEDDVVTNVFLYKDRDVRNIDRRYAMMHNSIDEAESMTKEEAMSVLEAVNQDARWSAVYDLEQFSVEISFNADYTQTFDFEGKE